ncbi:tetraspanin-16-like isoform X2 [Scyliorhinus canicula]|uniref:tetraspanin-16-like isoform X2 n=1 Tax=Scyliorhinus canicula TaxID=7830 RepID=UPI0018F6D2BF|nr:tetraspanin-16-like isoform X2 [Scyliorhinus canicula]
MESHVQSVFFCIKFLMVGINAVITVAGFVLLGFGVWVKVHGDSILQILGTRAGHFLNVGYFCIAAGCFLALLGFIGCCGVIKESKLLLMLFFLAMATLFIGEITCAIVILVFQSIVATVFHEEALNLLKNNYTGFGDRNFASYGWDSVMSTFHCCGLNNYTDFIDSFYEKRKGRLYPKSCCLDPTSTDCDGIDISATVIYTKGCFNAVSSMIKRNSIVVGGVAVGIAVIEYNRGSCWFFPPAATHCRKNRQNVTHSVCA